MDIHSKVLAFEYLLTQLINWGKCKQPFVSYMSFTRLKALKLLFFTAAVRNEQGGDLLDVFDNFYALPNGPVESDIYNRITCDELTYYTFRDFSVSTKQQYDENSLPEDLRNRINAAVEALKRMNPDIIAYRADQLVALSHNWQSWQDSMLTATALMKGSFPMDVNQIRNNPQFFTI